MWNPPAVAPRSSGESSAPQGDAPRLHIAPAEESRTYLQRIARGEQNPIVIVLGQSSSGKSTLVDALHREFGISSATRLLPRRLREGDTDGDAEWTSRRTIREIGPGFDSFDPRSIVFSDFKYQGYYGFPARELVADVKAGRGASLIVGRCVEVAPVIEACQNLFPGTPIVTVRLAVPESLLAARLKARPEAHPGEHQERLDAIRRFGEEDREQIRYLTAAYGMQSIVSGSAVELAQVPGSIVEPRMTLADVRPVFHELISDAKERSAKLAADILKPRNLRYDDRAVPNALIDVLDNKLAVAADTEGITVCIKGGLAAALYAKSPRPVSLDIDFAIRETRSCEAQVTLLLHTITGAEVAPHDQWAKKVYNVRGIHGVASSDRYGQEVELDALVKTRVQPAGTLFRYEFPLDALDEFYSRSVELPSGRTVKLVPPEQLIIEKLTAGRGAEIGKFDLYDVAGVAARVELNPALIRKLIDSQRFRPDSNPEVMRLLGATDSLPTIDVLDRLSINCPETRREALNLGPVVHLSATSEMPHSEKGLTLDVLMRLVLVRHLQSSIARLEASINDPIRLQSETSSIADQFGEELVTERMGRLNALLEYYRTFELGRRDVFVRRGVSEPELRDAYFSKLEPQRMKLARNGDGQ